ncbi:hypothetical protein J3R82DRAFT_8428 [Butyriboletus roseoflavus]|nr:hypothetical protein J3R82DRAFT_8428 [Butyriboletus roseoflavus]
MNSHYDVEQSLTSYKMSCSITLSFHHLPLDILHGIFHHLDIPDILRIRRVSRYLNGVTHRRDVWSDAYRKANFVRPPGPFLSQSAHDLEHALVPSFRVDQNLRHGGGTTQREKPTLKLREIRYTGVDLCVSLVFGRFLFIALSEEVRCYDLNIDASDRNSGASIIYRSTSRALRSFRCVSAIDVEGRPFACAVLSETTRTSFSAQETTHISIYSLNVTEPSEVALDLLHQFEYRAFVIDAVDLGPRVIVIQGRMGLDVDADWRLVALDVHARMQFLLPSFIDAAWEATEMLEWDEDEITPPTSISTSTHLLLARSFYTQAVGWNTFLQAFTLPHPNTHRHFAPPSTPLRPSHRGIIPGINVRDSVLLHDAVLDGPTQDVLITVCVHAFEPSRPRRHLSRYGILRLGVASREELGTVAFKLLGSLGQLSRARMPFLHPSFNGAGRAFYTIEPGLYGIVAALEYDVRGGGGGNDDEPEAKVIEYPSILRFPTPRTLLDYDPYSGRICLRSAMAKYSVIEVLDLAV